MNERERSVREAIELAYGEDLTSEEIERWAKHELKCIKRDNELAEEVGL